MGTPIKHFVCRGAARSYAFKCRMLALVRHASPIWNGRRIWSASRFCGISGEIYWEALLTSMGSEGIREDCPFSRRAQRVIHRQMVLKCNVISLHVSLRTPRLCDSM